ncbi:MAG: rhodanese-like domain-containing protein [Coraliomargarita sp.]
MTLLREFLILSLLVLIGSIYSLVSGLSPAPWAEPELAPGEIRLEDARTLNPIWLDARSEAIYAESHIPSALLFNEDNFDDALIDVVSAWLDSPRPIIVYCSSEQCQTSSRIADRLRTTLLESDIEAEIYSLKGGWDAWVQLLDK